MRRSLFVIVLVLLGFLCAAEGALPSSTSRRVLFSLARDRSSSFTEADALAVSRSMLARLQASRSDIVLIERPVALVAASETDLSSEAGSTGADGWVSVALSGSWLSMRVAVRAFDLLAGAMVLDQSFTRAGLSFGELPLEGWNDIVRALAPGFPSGTAAAPEQPASSTARLTIRARAGTRVTVLGGLGLDGPALEIGPDGSASRDLPSSREYLLRGELPGFFPATIRIFLSADREVTLPQRPSSRWALEVSLQDLAYPRLDLTWFFVPATVYLKMGLTTYLVGLSFDSVQVFSSAPLTTIEIQAGGYLNPADSLFRFSVGAGCLVRVAAVPGSSFGLDPLSPGGVRGFVGMEVSPSPRARFFFEITPTAYMTTQPDVFQQSLGFGSFPVGWFSAISTLVDISFRVGIRWML